MALKVAIAALGACRANVHLNGYLLAALEYKAARDVYMNPDEKKRERWDACKMSIKIRVIDIRSASAEYCQTVLMTITFNTSTWEKACSH